MSILIEGYAAVFGVPDRSGDVIVRGAFSDWLKAAGSGLVLPIHWMHDHSPKVGGGPTRTPIGATTLISQRELGLYFKAQLADTPKANEIAELVRIGAARGSSIAWAALKGGINGSRPNRRLSRIMASEITVTTSGAQMHPAAFVRPLAAGEMPSAEIEGAAA